MDKAKAAINDFMSKSGHHDTTVHETVAPAVKNETVKPHTHEELHTAVDKEVHQDHYHRTVQPVKDREVLPEQHTTKLGAVQHREFDHRDADHTKRNLAADQAQFKDRRVVEDHTHSQSAHAAVGGEHVHHHVHETIQPVVHKETIQPNVVHTTVPIHEVHHNAATHHDTSELPAMTMSEFKQKGGVLGGREERYDGFEGEPKHIGGTLKHMMEGHTSKRDSHQDAHVRDGARHGDFNPLDGGKHNTSAGRLGQTAEDANRSATAAERERMHATGSRTGASGLTGATGATGATGLAGNTHHEKGLPGTHRDHNATTGALDGATGVAGNTHHGDKGLTGSHKDHNTTTGAVGGATGAGVGKKPSLLDRINPMKDTDGDGKKGIMD